MSFSQIRSISLTGKTHLRDLFDKTKFNNIKVQLGLLILGIFDYTRSVSNGGLMIQHLVFRVHTLVLRNHLFQLSNYGHIIGMVREFIQFYFVL